MKITVKDYLHIRVGSPSVNAPTYQYLAPGSEIDIDDQLYKGDLYEGIDVWVRDHTNNYYWSGGLLPLPTTLSMVISPSKLKFDYHSSLNLPEDFKATQGSGVVVAIIDTGCYNHKALGDSILTGYDVFTKQPVQRDQSGNGHGTFLAGMIAARDIDGEIKGVAPQSKLIIVKAVQDDEVFADSVLDGLKWLRDNHPETDIINLSVDFDPGNLSGQFDSVLADLKSDTIIIAAGQNNSLLYSSTVFYPANHSDVVGVGSIDKSSVLTDKVNSQIDFIVPDLNFLSCNNFGSGYSNLHGSSMATALVTGAAALICSWKKRNGNSDSVISILNNSLSELSKNQVDTTLKIFKR